MGLAPGEYKAKIDEAQMAKLGMSCSPEVDFTIRQSKDGDVADGLEFILHTLVTQK
jgi:hypothetical protein